MAVPVILETQSVLEYLQWQAFEFQPYALNNPTAWNCSPLPTGVSFDPATGEISGAASRPGVFVIGLTAINSDGASSIQTFTIGIEATVSVPPVDAVEIVIDLGTMETAAAIPVKRTVARRLGATGDPITPVLWVKENDVRLFNVRFVKAGLVVPLDLLSLNLAMKAYEPEARVVVASDFVRADTGDNTFYRLAVTVESAALTGELSDDETDDATEFCAIAELEWTQSNSLVPTVGPDTLRTSTLNFFAGIAREMNP